MPPENNLAAAVFGRAMVLRRVPTRRALPPLAAFLAARALLAAAAAASGFAPFTAVLWKRWDSNLYLSIARDGYELVECWRIGYAPTGWCGNAGWMPGYPALLAALAQLGMDPLLAGALLSAAFELGTLAIAWNTFLEARWTPRAALALLLCALWPGMVYAHAIFPISQCTFLMLACLWLLLRDRPAGAGIAGGLAAFSYSTGFLLAPVATVWLLARRRPAQALVCGALACAGIGAVFAIHHVQLGAWDAFLRVQAKYEHGLQAPWSAFAAAVRPLFEGTGQERLPALQTLCMGAGMIALVIWRLLRGVTARDALLLSCAVTFWLFRLVVGGVSLPRSEALVVPAALLLEDAPAPFLAVLAAGCAALAFGMAQLFFRGILV